MEKFKYNKKPLIIVSLLLVLIAVFIFSEKKITLKDNDEVVDTVRSSFLQRVKLREYEKHGYIFKGWKNKKGEITDEIKNPIINYTLEAALEPISYIITYVRDGGEFKDLDEVVKKYTIEDEVKLPEMEKEHYDFKGFKVKSEILENIKKGTTGNIIAYALWEPREYSVKLELDGGKTNEETEFTYKYGDKLSLPTPELSGHTFYMWYTNEEKTEKFDREKVYGENLTLYATYAKKQARSASGGSGGDLGGAPAGVSGEFFVKSGNYKAYLSSCDPYDEAGLQGIVDGPGAFYYNLVSGSEYIADHVNQGGSAFLNNDVLYINRADGTVDKFVKTGSRSAPDGSWDTYDGFNVYYQYGGNLVTQTCLNGDLVYGFWDKSN